MQIHSLMCQIDGDPICFGGALLALNRKHTPIGSGDLVFMA